MNQKCNTESTNQRFSQAVERFRTELDRLTDMAWTRGEEVLGQFRNQDSTSCDWTPAVDIVETNDTILVFMNLPGLSSNDVELTLIGNTLEVTADLNSLTLQDHDRVIKRERPTGHLKRVVTLPCPVENDSASAQTEKGVFKVEMQKSVDNRIRKVPITQVDEPAHQTQNM